MACPTAAGRCASHHATTRTDTPEKPFAVQIHSRPLGDDRVATHNQPQPREAAAVGQLGARLQLEAGKGMKSIDGQAAVGDDDLGTVIIRVARVDEGVLGEDDRCGQGLSQKQRQCRACRAACNIHNEEGLGLGTWLGCRSNKAYGSWELCVWSHGRNRL